MQINGRRFDFVKDFARKSSAQKLENQLKEEGWYTVIYLSQGRYQVYKSKGV